MSKYAKALDTILFLIIALKPYLSIRIGGHKSLKERGRAS
jgi:hypothetical protein